MWKATQLMARLASRTLLTTSAKVHLLSYHFWLHLSDQDMMRTQLLTAGEQKVRLNWSKSVPGAVLCFLSSCQDQTGRVMVGAHLCTMARFRKNSERIQCTLSATVSRR